MHAVGWRKQPSSAPQGLEKPSVHWASLVVATHLHLGLRHFLRQEGMDVEKPNPFPHVGKKPWSFFLSKSKTWVSSLTPSCEWGLQLTLGT